MLRDVGVALAPPTPYPSVFPSHGFLRSPFALQALIHAKSQRQADAHDRLHRSLYPTPDDKAAAYQELVRSNELLMQ